MRWVALITLSLVCRAPATLAQDAPPADPSWVAGHPEIARLHTPGSLLRLGVLVVGVPNPLDPVGVAAALSSFSPVSVGRLPPPEIAAVLRDADEGTRSAIATDLGEDWLDRFRSARSAFPESWQESLTDQGLAIDPASDELFAEFTSSVAGGAAIGRVAAVADAVDLVVVLAEEVTLNDRDASGTLIADRFAIIDADAVKQGPRAMVLALSGGEDRVRFRQIVHAIGAAFWRQLSNDERARFNAEHWPAVDAQAGEGRTRLTIRSTSPSEAFIEAFVIACLYPTTFETAPIAGVPVFPPGETKPTSQAMLERLRFVDDLIRPIDEAFSRELLDKHRPRRSLFDTAVQSGDESDKPRNSGPSLTDLLNPPGD